MLRASPVVHEKAHQANMPVSSSQRRRQMSPKIQAFSRLLKFPQTRIKPAKNADSPIKTNMIGLVEFEPTAFPMPHRDALVEGHFRKFSLN
ncbi:hypothetical protein QQ056_06810 [Oscillatoria laete-virens NRMC-F 0139]|nr:hypothetical protein [Oscillatoria laete-virens]MDL5053254.1 hypothetical protein [Oscillatoria laete-virens NRMC-F 0139]